jgi:large subunit ribosomal protein L7/L12
MSLSAPCAAARCCRLATRSPATSSTRCLRLTSSTSFNRRRKQSRRWQSTDAAATSPKISGIVDQISQLTLLETADLVASLKVCDLECPKFQPQPFCKTQACFCLYLFHSRVTNHPVLCTQSRLNIPEISFAAPAAASSSAAAAPAAAAEEDDAPPAAAEKSLFTLKLQSFEAASKPKIIKEVKSMLGLSLVDSKKFVESAPKVLKEGVSKEEGEKILSTIKALGGVVVME